MKEFDPYTFGNSPACIRLANMLSSEENPHVIKNYSRILARFNKAIKVLAEIKDSELRTYLVSIVTDHTINTISNQVIAPHYISYMRNVALYRKNVLLGLGKKNALQD